MKALSFLVIVIIGTAIDGSAQSLRESQERIEAEKILEWLERRLQEYPKFFDAIDLIERREELERLKGLREGQAPDFTEKYLRNKSGSREYCAADYLSVTASPSPYRWCRYDDMAACLEATRDHSNYSCELNQLYRRR